MADPKQFDKERFDMLQELASRFAPGCIRPQDTLQMEPFTHAELSAIHDALLAAASQRTPAGREFVEACAIAASPLIRQAWADHCGIDVNDERVQEADKVGWPSDYGLFERGWNAAVRALLKTSEARTADADRVQLLRDAEAVAADMDRVGYPSVADLIRRLASTTPSAEPKIIGVDMASGKDFTIVHDGKGGNPCVLRSGCYQPMQCMKEQRCCHDATPPSTGRESERG